MQNTSNRQNSEGLTEPVYFRNTQWAVTGYGIESLQPNAGYNIEAECLAERRGKDEPLYNWPMHMAAKGWVDIDLFLEAFQHALYLHTGKYGEPPSFHIFHRTEMRARERAILASEVAFPHDEPSK